MLGKSAVSQTGSNLARVLDLVARRNTTCTTYTVSAVIVIEAGSKYVISPNMGSPHSILLD